MPRTARLNYPGGVFHVISRFVDGRFVLRGEAERAQYLTLLGRALTKTDTEVLAWCLMSNHVHLVVVQGQEPLARLLKSVHTGMAGWLNRRGKRGRARGAVFAGRPKTLLVDKDAYLLQLVRYVHNNPVRAGVVSQARQSKWSSHSAYVGLVEPPPWLRLGFVLEQLAKNAATARKRFESFVNEGAKEAQRVEFSAGTMDGAISRAHKLLGDGWRVSDPILGGDAFIKRVARDVQKVDKALRGGSLPASRGQRITGVMVRDVVDAVCAYLGIEPWDFEARPKVPVNALARQLIVWLWVRDCGGKQIEVARELQTSTSLVSRWYSHAMRAADDIDGLAAAVALELAGLRRRPKRGLRSSRIRYQVDVEE